MGVRCYHSHIRAATYVHERALPTMTAGFGMMGRHGDLLQDLLEYQVGAVQHKALHTRSKPSGD